MSAKLFGEGQRVLPVEGVPQIIDRFEYKVALMDIINSSTDIVALCLQASPDLALLTTTAGSAGTVTTILCAYRDVPLYSYLHPLTLAAFVFRGNTL